MARLRSEIAVCGSSFGDRLRSEVELVESEVLPTELLGGDSCSSLLGQTQVWLERTQEVQRGLVSSHFLRLLRQVRHPFLERGWFRRYFVGYAAPLQG